MNKSLLNNAADRPLRVAVCKRRPKLWHRKGILSSSGGSWLIFCGAGCLRRTWRILFNKTEMKLSEWRRFGVIGRAGNTGSPGGSLSCETWVTLKAGRWTICSLCPWCGRTMSSSAVGKHRFKFNSFCDLKNWKSQIWCSYTPLG